MSHPASRSTYTKAQIEQYFDRISLPERHRKSPILDDPSLAHTITHGLPLLSALQRYSLAAIPFENLELHYSTHHTISLDPAHLFYKIVERNSGRGGYCMENSCIFGTVLVSLGFDVLATGGRVNDAPPPTPGTQDWTGPRYTGFSHMINIVTMENRRFHVDVGFGSAGPTRPVELIHGNQWVNVPPQQSSRLVRSKIAESVASGPGQELWVYEARFSDADDWRPMYCYGETEFLPADYAVMNHSTSTSRTSWFTYRIVCVKMIMGEATDGEEAHIIGDFTLSGNEIKKRVAGKSEKLATFNSEHERVEALRTHFGIKLSEPERNGIKGMMTAL